MSLTGNQGKELEMTANLIGVVNFFKICGPNPPNNGLGSY